MNPRHKHFGYLVWKPDKAADGSFNDFPGEQEHFLSHTEQARRPSDDSMQTPWAGSGILIDPVTEPITRETYCPAGTCRAAWLPQLPLVINHGLRRFALPAPPTASAVVDFCTMLMPAWWWILFIH